MGQTERIYQIKRWLDAGQCVTRQFLMDQLEVSLATVIFAGKAVQRAGLRFTPERARWVAAERWHPEQRGRFDANGYWVLDVPYADSRELVMDILRHVPDVEVLWPDELAEEVRRRLVEGLLRMGGGAG